MPSYMEEEIRNEVLLIFGERVWWSYFLKAVYESEELSTNINDKDQTRKNKNLQFRFSLDHEVRVRSWRKEIINTVEPPLNSHCFKSCCCYSTPLNLSNVAEFFWSWISKVTISNFQPVENSYVYRCSESPYSYENLVA